MKFSVHFLLQHWPCSRYHLLKRWIGGYNIVIRSCWLQQLTVIACVFERRLMNESVSIYLDIPSMAEIILLHIYNLTEDSSTLKPHIKCSSITCFTGSPTFRFRLRMCGKPMLTTRKARLIVVDLGQKEHLENENSSFGVLKRLSCRRNCCAAGSIQVHS